MYIFNMKNITYTDISERKTFNALGDKFVLIATNAEHNSYLYKRIGKTVSYEIVIPIKRKNKNGTIAYVYPPTENFGYGRALYTKNFERALIYLDNGLQRIGGC